MSLWVDYSGSSSLYFITSAPVAWPIWGFSIDADWRQGDGWLWRGKGWLAGASELVERFRRGDLWSSSLLFDGFVY